MTDFPPPMAPAQGPIVGDDSTPPSVVLPVPGVEGVVTLENWRSSKPFIAVNGKRKSLGSTVRVKRADGTKATIKIKALVGGRPRVYVDGVEVFTTPQPPLGLIFLAVLPALSFVIMQGALGIVIAISGVAGAQVVARNEKLSTGKRALAIVGVAVATWLVALGAVVLIFGLWR